MRSSGFTLTDEVACLQTCAVLGDESVSDYRPIPHLLGDPAAGPIQHRADIPCAIRAHSIDLQSEAIVQPPAHWPSADRHAMDFSIIANHTDAELAPNGGPVMSVKAVYVV